MDVTHPLPDVPIFEPFRPRDPVTAQWDERTGRDPFKWRKMSPESWRKNHEKTYRDDQFHGQAQQKPTTFDPAIHGEPDFSETGQVFWADEQTHKAEETT